MGHDIIQLLRNLSPDVAELNRDVLAGAAEQPSSSTPATIGSERELQQAVVEWCQVVASAHNRPEYGYIMAIPNGQYRRGQRPEPGLRPGAPDLFLPVARRGHHGLWLELKFGRNTTTAQQDWWLATLREQGYCCAVVRSLEEAQEVIDWYLRGTR